MEIGPFAQHQRSFPILKAMPTAVSKYDVFISYSHKDKALVEPLVQLLSVSARRVFWDAQSLVPGQVWPVEIERAIAGCKRFVLLWCCDTAGSEYVAKEVRLALEHGRVIIPVRLCSLAPPDNVADRQWIDLQGKVSHVCKVEGELAERHRKGLVTGVKTEDDGTNTAPGSGFGAAAAKAAGAAIGALVGTVSLVGFLPFAPLGAIGGGVAGRMVGSKLYANRKRSGDEALDTMIRGYFEGRGENGAAVGQS